MSASDEGCAIAYLVLAHTAPEHLSRLVASLGAPPATVLIHLDARVDAAEFGGVLGPDVRLTRRRVAVRWGDFSQVEAILVLLREAFDDPRHFERFVLISGVDHPLRSAAGLRRFFADHPDREFMNLVPMPDDAAGKPISRLTTYQFRPRHGLLGRRVWTVLMAVGRRLHRRHLSAALGDLAPYGGSTWWAVTRDACEWILGFPEREPRAARFFRRVVCPDESYFQTIVGNSPFRARADASLTFTDWRAGGANPARLTGEHLPTLLALARSHDGPVTLFARKFGDEDGDLVDRLTQEIARDGSVGAHR